MLLPALFHHNLFIIVNKFKYSELNILQLPLFFGTHLLEEKKKLNLGSDGHLYVIMR